MQPEIEERYAEYRPSFDLVKAVRDLITPVPKIYLRGLRKVLLVDAHCGTRYRSIGIVSQARKRKLATIRGLYHYNDGDSWIEIRADQAIKQWAQFRGGLWFSPIRYLCVGEVLYHELGHHIHRAISPEIGDQEVVAERWRKRLLGNFIRKRYWYLFPVLFSVAWSIRKIRKPLFRGRA